MKRFIPLAFLLLGALFLASTLAPTKNKTAFDLAGFGRLPVLSSGRLKPLDTIARTSLLTIQGRQRVGTPERTEPYVATSSEWLADVLFAPDKADNYPTFKIESPEVLTLLGLTENDTRINYDSTAKRVMAVLGFLPSSKSRFSYNQLRPKLEDLEAQARLAEQVESQLRTPFQRQVITMSSRVTLYLQLKTSLQIPVSPDFFQELTAFNQALPSGIAAILARESHQPHSEEAVKAMKEMADRFTYMEQFGTLRPIPPPAGDNEVAHWLPMGTALMNAFGTGRVDDTTLAFAELGHAWRSGDAARFNRIVARFQTELAARYPAAMQKSNVEARFNAADPFYTSINLYVLAFLAGIFSWLKWPDELGRGAFWLLALAFAAATAGIATRMWLESRPPVTNLYSSALFIGWGAVLLCIILEKIYHNGIGSVAGGATGFATLLIAYNLALTNGGDTMEMMRAVLDSNFWLGTHVVTVTIGYAATYLAGFLAIIYIFRGLFTKSLDAATADALTRMVYGIVCFATLFSLVGTVLGGIWADQSWGRFWGWDPKENGALIIVIWNAIILHARWGGMIRQRGLMVMAVFGNVVTSWSWFGTNMLGVGLHSYGFMEAAFYWLVGFVLTQIVLMALALVPLDKWRSFASRIPAA
ncbi:MAG: cytochrome c biogenesis protein [Opitutales bacterium]